MKCYYPIDSAGNRIGFKTPEACVYDASGTSLTTKLAQINSNIKAKADPADVYSKAQIDHAFEKASTDSIIPFETGYMNSNNTSVTTDILSYVRYGNILSLEFHGTIKSMSTWTNYYLWTLPHEWKVAGSARTPLWQDITGTCPVVLTLDGGYGSPYLNSGGTTITNLHVSGSLICILG